MKPAPFEYHRPTSVDEVVGLLSAAGGEAKVLAGGQSLVPMLNLRLTRFEQLVDVNRIPELCRIDVAGDGAVRIGAMVRQCEIEESPQVASVAPLLTLASGHIGHFQIRSRGTVGGSIAHADPAAEYPAAALALDAEMEVTGPAGTRRVAAAGFFTGTWTTVLGAEDLLVAMHVRPWGANARFAVQEVARREGDFAIAGATVGVEVADGTVTRAAIGLFGLGSTPVRASGAEEALVGQLVDVVDTAAAGRQAVEGLDPPGDLHASGALRTRIGAAVVRRALDEALGRAGSAVAA